MTRISDAARINITVTGARGRVGVDVAGEVVPGEFLVWDADRRVRGASGTGADAGLRVDMAAGAGASLVGFLSSGVGAVARSIFAWLMNQPLLVESFGGVYDGTVNVETGEITGTDSGPALRKALNAAALLNLPVRLSKGKLRVTTADILTVGYGWNVAADGMTIYGCGPESAIIFEDNTFGTAYLFRITADYARFRDFTVYGKGTYWARPFSFHRKADPADPIRNPTIERVTISGVGNQYIVEGIGLEDVDIDDLLVRDVHFTKGSYLWVKSMSDVSVQRRMRFENITGKDCIEILELNTPGFFFGRLEAGSDEITEIRNADGNPFSGAVNGIPHAIGQEIRSAFFPAGTVVTAIDTPAGTMTVSNPATQTRTATTFTGDIEYASNVVSGIDPADLALGAGLVGQQIYVPAYFPVNTYISAVNVGAGTVTLTQPSGATANDVAIPTQKARISAGGIYDTTIDGLYGEDIRQWPIGLAHCVRGTIRNAYGLNCWHEVLHAEDVSSGWDVELGGYNCNTVRGVVIPGSPQTDNANACGLAHITSGCYDFSVRLVNADLTGPDTKSRTAVAIQAGGQSGTTGTEDLPYDIRVSGKANACGPTGANQDTDVIVALGGLHVAFDEFWHLNDPANKAASTLKAPDGSWSGTASIVGPGVIVTTGTGAGAQNYVLKGLFDRLTLFTPTDFADLRWASGFFPVARNSCAVARSVTFNLPDYDRDAGAWKPLCPAPYAFLGDIMRQFHGSGGTHAYETGEFEIRYGVLQPTEMRPVEGGNLAIALDVPAPVVTTGSVTNNDTLITGIGSLANVEAGTPVSGDGIPAGARVAQLITNNSLRLDKLATATDAAADLTFTPVAKSTHGWRVNAGWLEYRAYSVDNDYANLVVSMNGVLVADVPLA